MTEAVVDVFEAVDIQQCQRQSAGLPTMRIPSGLMQRLRKLRIEVQTAVRPVAASKSSARRSRSRVCRSLAALDGQLRKLRFSE